MKRYALSLTLVLGSIASFVACGSSDDGSSTTATTSTTSAAAGGNTSASTTSTASNNTTASTASNNTTTGTAAGGATSSGTTTSGTGGSPTAAGYCRATCTAASDCCNGLPNCPGSAYPYDPTCDNGFCTPAQCGADSDCNAGGALPNYKCLELSGFHFCGASCSTAADCTPVQGITYTCGGDDNGVDYCQAMGTSGACTMDSQCQGLGKCDNGVCDCTADSDCTVAGTKCAQ